MRKLLVVAFHYPPDNSSTGVLRTLKFTQYLLAHGWLSEVISVPESLYANRDEELRRRIPPEVRVHRVQARDAKQTFGWRGRYPAFLEVPDRFWTWYFSGRRRGARLASDGSFSAIYSTSPLSTAHLIGWGLKRKTGLPWIADFRDSWVDDLLGPLRRRVDGWLERRVVTAADYVLMNTPAMHRYYVKTYADLPAAKFVVIPNGYDEEDFTDLTLSRPDHFEIVYAGALNAEHRNPEPLLAALAETVRRGAIPREDLRLTFLGCGAYGTTDSFRRTLESHSLRDVTRIVADRVPYREALRQQAAASLIVVLVDDVTQGRDWTTMAVPAKLYEYVRLGNRTLVLATGQAVTEFLVSVGLPPPIPPSDTARVGAALRAAYDAHRTPGGRSAAGLPAGMERYERRSLTAELARLLDRLVGADR